MFDLNENGWFDCDAIIIVPNVHCNAILVSIISDKQLFKNAYVKVKKSILKNDEKSAKQIIAVLKKDQRHAINFAPDEEDTLLYLYVNVSLATPTHCLNCIYSRCFS